MLLYICSVRNGRVRKLVAAVGVFYGCNLRAPRLHTIGGGGHRSKNFLFAARTGDLCACEFCIDQKKKCEKTDDGWIDKRPPHTRDGLPDVSYSGYTYIVYV